MTWKFGNCDLQIAGTWSCHLILKQVLISTLYKSITIGHDGKPYNTKPVGGNQASG